MTVFRVDPRILPEEYDAFLDVLLDDYEFPTHYDEWLERTKKKGARRRARGEVVKELTIHPNEFADWCEANGLVPGVSHLEAFAVAKALRTT